MFNGIYVERNYKKIKMIIDHFGHPFFQQKTVLDLGCGHGDIGAAFYRLGSQVMCVDARNEHIKLAGKKYPGIKTMCLDLDKEWPFGSYDVILDLDLIPHLKNFENHFRNVCNNAKYVAIETAVCDASDPYLCQVLVENKFTYDSSMNGFSSRPTAAMVERIFNECGFEFKRYDYSKLNLGKEIYDWRLANTGTCDVNKRRFWIAKKKGEVRPAINLPLVDNKGVLRMGGKLGPIVPIPLQHTIKIAEHSANYNINIPIIEDPIRNSSKEFSLIYAENYVAPKNFPSSGIILPMTQSSRAWLQKIIPFFPNLKVHNLAKTMIGFNKSGLDPNVAMCSIHNLYPCSRIWIEEFQNYELTEKDIKILNECSLIMTPSLINAQAISKICSNANIKKIGHPWPLLPTLLKKEDYFLYFEKSPHATKALIKGWHPNYGKLKLVGASLKLPSFMDYVSDCENYSKINKLIQGAKAIIDISNNTYYMSGIAGLAKALNIPIITNNNYQLDYEKHIYLSQDKDVSTIDIKSAYEKFSQGNYAGGSIDQNHNDLLNDFIKELAGL